MGVVTPQPERFAEGIRNQADGVPEDVRVYGVITLEDVVERMVPCSIGANHQAEGKHASMQRKHVHATVSVGRHHHPAVVSCEFIAVAASLITYT